MSRWDETVTRTAQDATQFWAAASLDTLNQMMTPRWAWEAWLEVAAGVITEPGSVFEPGCGIGLLTDLLPAGCTYYGCDVNPLFVEVAEREHSGPGVRFAVRDLFEVLDSGESFDWIIVTSLFGMFPEQATYDMIPRFWAGARKGVSFTTIDKRLYSSHRRLRFDFTSHDPGDLLGAVGSLAGVGATALRHGRDFPQFRGHYWQRCLALYAWRQGVAHAGAWQAQVGGRDEDGGGPATEWSRTNVGGPRTYGSVLGAAIP
jgi:SAM-dependent methyltransferase